MISLVLRALLIINFFAFVWAFYFFFNPIQTPGRSATILKYVGLVKMFGSVYLFRTMNEMSVAIEIPALSLAVVSAGVFWWAIVTNRLQPLDLIFSKNVPMRIVQNGPYRWVRHPFYAAYSLTWIACDVAIWNFSLFLLTVTLSWLYYVSAKSEEELLLSSPAGAEFREYRKRVGSFYPRLFRLRRG